MPEQQTMPEKMGANQRGDGTVSPPPDMKWEDVHDYVSGVQDIPKSKRPPDFSNFEDFIEYTGGTPEVARRQELMSAVAESAATSEAGYSDWDDDTKLFAQNAHRDRAGLGPLESLPEQQTFGEFIEEDVATWGGLVKRLPFVGAGKEAWDLSEVLIAANRAEKAVDSNAKVSEEDQRLLEDFFVATTKAARGKTWGGMFSQTVSAMPTFMAEMALSGGLVPAAKAGVKKAVTTVARRKISAIVSRMIVGSALMSKNLAVKTAARAPFFGFTASKNTFERMVPGYTFEPSDMPNEEGSMQFIMGKKGDSLLRSLPGGVLDTLIEVASEQLGGELGNIQALRLARTYAAAGIARVLKSEGKDYSMTAVAKLLKAGHFDGVPEEFVEERFGGAMRVLVQEITGGKVDFGATVFPETMKDLTVEVASLAVPGAAPRAIGTAVDFVRDANEAVGVGQEGLQSIRKFQESSSRKNAARVGLDRRGVDKGARDEMAESLSEADAELSGEGGEGQFLEDTVGQIPIDSVTAVKESQDDKQSVDRAERGTAGGVRGVTAEGGGAGSVGEQAGQGKAPEAAAGPLPSGAAGKGTEEGQGRVHGVLKKAPPGITGPIGRRRTKKPRDVSGPIGVDIKRPGKPPAGPSKPKESAESAESAGKDSALATIPVADIQVDAERFQFKMGMDAEGVGPSLAGSEKFDPELANVVGVWRDPADGNIYIVNGHQRLGLAQRLGVDNMNVLFIKADTAEEARATGALMNITGNQGTAIDAGKFIRDKGYNQEELSKRGASFSDPLVRQGMALAALENSVFAKVVNGTITEKIGVTIGENLPNHADQKAVMEAIEVRKSITPPVLAELIRLAKGAPTTTQTQTDLFGETKEEKNLFITKAATSNWIRKKLAKEEKLFKFVSDEQRAAVLSEEKVADVDVEKGAELGEQAATAMFLYDKLTGRVGEVSTILNEAAEAIARGENLEKVRKDAYKRIKEAIQREQESGGLFPRSDQADDRPSPADRGEESGAETGDEKRQDLPSDKEGEKEGVDNPKLLVEHNDLLEQSLKALKEGKHEESNKLAQRAHSKGKEFGNAVRIAVMDQTGEIDSLKLKEVVSRVKDGFFSGKHAGASKTDMSNAVKAEIAALDARTDELLDKPKPELTPKEKARKELDAAKAALKKKPGEGFLFGEKGGQDPDLLAKLLRLMKAYINHGVTSFQEFMAHVKEDAEEQIANEDMVEALREAWNEEAKANDTIDEAPPETPETPPVATGGPIQSDTSIKNAATDAIREDWGLPQVQKPGVEKHQDVADRAERIMEDDPGKAPRLVDEILLDPGKIRGTLDEMIVQRYLTMLQMQGRRARAQMREAADKGDSANEAIHRNTNEVLAGQIGLTTMAADRMGTPIAQALNIRRRRMDDNFDLVEMKMQASEAQNGTPLTKEEEKEVEALNEAIERALEATERHAKAQQEAEGKLEAETRRAAELEMRLIQSEVALEKERKKKAAPKAAPKSKPAPTKPKTRPKEESARKMIKEAEDEITRLLSGRVGAGVDPALLKPLVKYVRGQVALGVAKFQGLMERLTEKWGAEKATQIEETAQAAWDEVHSEEEAEPVEVPKAPKKLKNNKQISRYAKKLAKYFIAEEGVTELDALITQVHGVLAEDIPDVTWRDTLDAIAGYGQYTLLNMEEAEVVYRDLVGQSQQTTKLEDMKKGKAPLLFGREHPTMSDEERRLVKLVNEGKRKGGYVITDPAKQARSREQQRLTTKIHKLRDLKNAIATKQKLPERGKLEPTPESIALDKQIAEAQAEYNAIFKDQEAADRKQTANYNKQLKRRIEDWKARIARKDFSPKAKVAKTKFNKETEKLRYQLEKVKDKWHARRRQFKLDDRTVAHKAGMLVPEAMNTQRALLTGFEFSAAVRQGGIVAVSHPRAWAKAVLETMFNKKFSLKKGEVSLTPFITKEDASRVENEIDQRPNAGLYKLADLARTIVGGALWQQEEVFMTRMAELIPGLAGSARAYTTFLNRMRADLFDMMVVHATRNGQPITLAEAKIIANWVNSATGRTQTKGFQRTGVFLSTVFFAIRFQLSRFQILTFQPFWGGLWRKGEGWKDTKRARMAVLRENARAAAGIGTFYAAAAFTLYMLMGPPGDDPEDDWSITFDLQSSDAFKIRIGRTRIDPLMGLSQIMVVVTRLLSGETKTLKGKTVPIRKPYFSDGPGPGYGQATGQTVAGRFLRTKFAPAIGSGIDLLSGEDIRGNELELGTFAAGLVTPISYADTLAVMKAHGIPAGSAMQVLATIGMGVDYYEERRQPFNAKKVKSMMHRLGRNPPKGNRKRRKFRESQRDANEFLHDKGYSRSQVERIYQRHINKLYKTRETRREYMRRFRKEYRPRGR